MNLCRSLLLVAAGGSIGAIARYVISRWFLHRFRAALPFGTLFVNLAGSFLLGWIYGAHLAAQWGLLMGTGFMGAFTTFSTFGYELVQMGRSKNWLTFYGYLGLSVTLGILLAFGGYRLGSLFIQ